MVLVHDKAPPPSRPWDDAPEVEYRLFKNPINLARGYNSSVVSLKRLILRESANESDGTQFIIDEESIDTADGKLYIHKIPQLPISKNKYFIVLMYPPDDLGIDDRPMDGDKPVKFLFSFYNLYLTGFSYDDEIWHIFDDAMILGISQEARDRFVKTLGFRGDYNTIKQNYLKLGIGFRGQCDTYNKIVGVRSKKTNEDELIRALCRTTITLPESARFPFLAQFHLRSFHSGNFDVVLDMLVLEGEDYKNFSPHLTKWGTYSTVSKKGKEVFNASEIPASGIKSFSDLLNFIAVATNKKYDEENLQLGLEVEKNRSTGDSDADKKEGRQGQNKDNEESREDKKNDQDNDSTWFYQAPLMPYIPQGKPYRNLHGQPDVNRKTCLEQLSWTLLLQLAMREACKYVKEKLSVKVDKLGKDSIIYCAKTSMSSKLIHTKNAFIANMYLVKSGAIAVRRVRKEDWHHVAKATGATTVATFADMEGEEAFDPSFLGHPDEVVEERISDDEIILIKGQKNTSAVSNFSANVELALLQTVTALVSMVEASHLHLWDALFIGRRTLDSNMIAAGGGAVEAALSVYLENQEATTLRSVERLAIAEFAESLPKVYDELTLEGPSESSGMAKATLVECRSQTFCGLNILAADLAVDDTNCAQNWYADRAQQEPQHHDRYPLAMHETCKYVEEKLSVKVDKLGKDCLINCAKTSMSLKLVHIDSDSFANMVLPASHPQHLLQDYSIAAGGGALEAALSVYLGNQEAAAPRFREQLTISEFAESLPKVDDELTPEGPSESPGMAKATPVEGMSLPLCGPNTLAANLDAKCAQNWYADRAQEYSERHDRCPLGQLGAVSVA